MQIQEVMFKREDQVKNYGVYDFLNDPDFDVKNLGAFNDKGYIFTTNHSTDNWKMDHYHEELGDFEFIFSIVRNTCGLDYKLCIFYRHSHDSKMRQASTFELECAIFVIYEYLEYMSNMNLKPGIYIPGPCVSDNEENENIEDIDYYNSTYSRYSEEVYGVEECNELYHRIIALYNKKINKIALEKEQEEEKKNNLKMVDNILEKIKGTKLYRHYQNKYVIAQAQKRIKHNI